MRKHSAHPPPPPAPTENFQLTSRRLQQTHRGLVRGFQGSCRCKLMQPAACTPEASPGGLATAARGHANRPAAGHFGDVAPAHAQRVGAPGLLDQRAVLAQPRVQHRHPELQAPERQQTPCCTSWATATRPGPSNRRSLPASCSPPARPSRRRAACAGTPPTSCAACRGHSELQAAERQRAGLVLPLLGRCSTTLPVCD